MQITKEQQVGHINRIGALLRDTIHRLSNQCAAEELDVEIKQIGQDSIKVKGEKVSASHYRLKAEKFLIDLWYSADRRWLALDSTLENGRLLHYRIE